MLINIKNINQIAHEKGMTIKENLQLFLWPVFYFYALIMVFIFSKD